MAYQVLYRTYRPTTFDEVVGQEYIVKTLKNAIKTNRIAHAYLFCGPRGTGKTSIAKLFAKAVNCTGEEMICGECENCKAFLNNSHPDVIELDAASNNSVENIREIVDKVKYAPILGKYKVYIIDEVHMLSGAAFNALLKTLEEPPANVIFILATTEPNKIIPTVMSRCQRYNFSKVEPYDMRRRIEYILNKENIPYDDAAIDLIISLSDGGMRDVLSILEQVLAYGNYELRMKDVVEIFGLVSVDEKIKLLSAVKTGNISAAIVETRNLYQQGMDIKRLTQDLIQILKEAYLYLNNGEKLIRNINNDEAKAILDLYQHDDLVKDINELLKTLDSYKNTFDVLSYFEITLFRLANMDNDTHSSKQKLKETLVENRPTIKVIAEKNIQEPQLTQNKMSDIKTNKTEDIDNLADPNVEETMPFDTLNCEESTNLETLKTDNQNIAKQEAKELETENEELTASEKAAISTEYVNVSDEYLLSILVKATRELKMEDINIYQKLDNYSFDPEKKRFTNMIKGSEIFADSEDAIIFKHVLPTKKNAINEEINNRGLYWFLKDEFGIDKMPYCIDDKECLKLVNMFKHRNEYDLSNIKVERYQKTAENRSTEDVLREMFGDKLTIEE